MFLAKIAAPQAAHAELQYSVLSQAAASPLTLLAAPAGYLCTDSLAAALEKHRHPTLWLRLGPEDADPAVCLVSLITGAQKLCPTVGQTTLELMRRHPGPTAGWPPLFAHLGQELAKALPASTALVLEHVHHLGDAHQTLALLGAHLLPSLATTATCILTSHSKLPSTLLPAYAVYRDAGDMGLDAHSVSTLFQHVGAGLPPHCIERAASLTKGRADLLVGLSATAAELGPMLVQQAIEHATGLDDLFFRVTCAYLVTADTDTLQAMALAARLEYSHPSLVQATLGNVTLPASPWLQALTDNWTLVRGAWKTALHMALRARGSPSYAILHRMADYLASHDALERAVPLYCEIGDTASAAQAIAQVADTMLNLGQWQTLSNWLDQLTKPAPQGAERPHTPKLTSLWSRLLGTFGPGRRPSRPATLSEWIAPTPQGMLQDITESIEEMPVRSTPKTHPPKAKDEKQRRPALAVYCLGPFRVYQNDQLVTEWKSLKGCSILRYLVAHGGKPVSKDILMDVFWPNADPIAARRNLHQAVYALRQTLRQAQPDLQQIQFENDGYLLNPELDVWLDFEEFELHRQAGRRLEAAGQIAAAVTEYAIAEGLYQGDFLEEDLYEDWPSSQREHLRNIYVEIAERLSEYYVQQGQYTVGVTLCHKVLERDPCHEESHRRLMQCYLAQGQRHLAIRQYHTCVQALAKELDVPPADETRKLYASISVDS